MKKSRLLILIIILCGVYYFRQDLGQALKPYLRDINLDVETEGLLDIIDNKGNNFKTNIQKGETFLPGPLAKIIDAQKSLDPLDYKKIIEATNVERQKNGLKPLSENSTLNASATYKAVDMNIKQYFEHESPDGKNIEDLANNFNYEYATIGENLALGSFDQEIEIVTAWMNSPGHRANILNTKYTQIGIGLVKGTWEGHEVWFAVQHFGKPITDCPSIDKTLKSIIDSSQSKIKDLQTSLNNQKTEIDETKNKNDPAYAELVNAYNTLVAKYNNLIQTTKNSIDEYNRQVSNFNKCLD